MNTTPPIETTFEIVPAELGLELAAKNSLEVAFQGFFTTAKALQQLADAITSPKAARAARLEMKSLRLEVEKKHKEMKADSLLFGRAVDGAKNIFLAIATPIERQLDDIEKAEERAEAARIEALREERSGVLELFNHVTHGINLGTLSDADWTDYLQQAKDVYEVRKAREQKAKEEAEATAKKDAEEREAQRLENIRLREEADKAAAELAKTRAEQAKRDAATKAELEAAEKVRREESRKAAEAAEIARQKANADLLKERAEKAKIEAAAQALRDAEAKRIADEKAAADAKAKAEAAAAKKAAAAPDRAKLMQFAGMVRHLDVPLANSEAGKEVAAEIGAKVESFAKWIESQAATL